jgi:DNA-binding XRE family transcriptional regulator
MHVEKKLSDHDEIIDLANKRKEAGLTQADMAERLGISQPQISRYEEAPGDVPQRIVSQWMKICGHLIASSGIDFGDAYTHLRADVALLDGYLETAPPLGNTPGLENLLKPEEISASVHRFISPPLIGVAGPFDCGKSRLINTLMGRELLPTGHGPKTSIPTLIVNCSQRPAEIAEDVLLLREGFDLRMASDAAHLKAHRLVSGGPEMLLRYAVHNSSQQHTLDAEPVCALLWTDAPITRVASFMDWPGDGHSAEDAAKVERFARQVDVLFYCAGFKGYMGEDQVPYLRALLERVPTLPLSRVNGGFANVFLLCTQMNSPAEFAHVVNVAAERLYRNMGTAARHRLNRKPTVDDFRERIFPFLAEEPSVRSSFATSLEDLLAKEIPALRRRQVGEAVKRAKRDAGRTCEAVIDQFEAAIRDREKARASIAEMEAREPERKRKTDARYGELIKMIAARRKDTGALISGVLAPKLKADQIEHIVKDRYKDKKEAERLACSYVAAEVQDELNSYAKQRAEELVPKINELLNTYEKASEIGGVASLGGTTTPFNAEAVFIGALAATGTVGGLAVWAAAAAAGSNLGSWILIPTIVSWLSAIGISIPGTAAAVAAVAAFGGPVTIAIGIAVAVGAAIAAMFGPSWQTRLSRRIEKQLKDAKFLEMLQTGTERYWDETKEALSKGVAELERALKERHHSLRRMVSAENPAAMLEEARMTRDFFGGIPWRLQR